MKKLFCLFLSVLLAALCVVPAFAAEGSKSFGGYDHVFIIGVDGAGQFFRDADTPNFDRIFADGAVDYTARTETIAVSAQNWGSILTGVSYLRHLMTNSSAAKRERDSSTRYPTIFKYVRDAYPDAQLASVVNWNVINHGIIENDLGVYVHCVERLGQIAAIMNVYPKTMTLEQVYESVQYQLEKYRKLVIGR